MKDIIKLKYEENVTYAYEVISSAEQVIKFIKKYIPNIKIFNNISNKNTKNIISTYSFNEKTCETKLKSFFIECAFNHMLSRRFSVGEYIIIKVYSEIKKYKIETYDKNEIFLKYPKFIRTNNYTEIKEYNPYAFLYTGNNASDFSKNVTDYIKNSDSYKFLTELKIYEGNQDINLVTDTTFSFDESKRLYIEFSHYKETDTIILKPNTYLVIGKSPFHNYIEKLTKQKIKKLYGV